MAKKHRMTRLAWVLLILIIALVSVIAYFAKGLRMPGKSTAGEVTMETPTSDETNLAEALRRDVDHLCTTIGERNLTNAPDQLEQAAVWLEEQLLTSGWATVEQHEYQADGQPVRNLIVELPGSSRPDEIMVVGAHYDSAPGTAGANDNGSAVASLLALARHFSPQLYNPSARTLRLVFFVNEEPPYFQQEGMGSLQYARRCHQKKEKIVGMISLETMGYFSNEPDSQQYPLPILKTIYPNTGNFIAFVGSSDSDAFVKRCVGLFRELSQFPSEGTAIPKSVPGIGWSDHWSFDIHGYPAVMVTDTAPFRYPYYHTPEDTPDKIDYESLARVSLGIQRVMERLLIE